MSDSTNLAVAEHEFGEAFLVTSVGADVQSGWWQICWVVLVEQYRTCVATAGLKL